MNTQVLAMATVGVVACGVGLALSQRRVGSQPSMGVLAARSLGSLAALAAAYLLLARWRPMHTTRLEAEPVGWGLLAGFLAVLSVHLIGRKREPNCAVSLGVIGAAVALLGLLEPEVAGSSLAAAAIAAGVTSIAFSGPRELMTALLLAFAALSSIMAREAVPYGSTWQVGTVIVIAGAIGACTQSAIASRFPRLVGTVVGACVTLGVGALAVFRHLYVGDIFTILIGGLVVAVVSMIVCEEDSSEPSSMRLLLCALFVLGAGAWAFSLRHGFGVSVLLLSAGVFSALVGSFRALAVLSPLLSLVLLRVLIEWAGARNAVDLGQHYVLMGFAAGALLPLAAVQSNGEDERPWSSVLWQALLLGVPALAAVILTRAGVSGFLLGLMIAPIAASLVRSPTDRSQEAERTMQGIRAGVIAASAGLIAIFVTMLAPDGLVSRSAKVNALLWGIAATAVIAWLLSGSPAPSLKTKADDAR